jgi:hypothetical protein
MEVEFAVKIFQVAMAIDESRQNRPALDIDNFGPFWDRDITSHPHSSNSPRLNDDYRAVDRCAPRSVYESSTLYDQRLFRHFLLLGRTELSTYLLRLLLRNPIGRMSLLN